MELSKKDFYTLNSKGYLTTVSVFPDLCEPLMGDAAFNFMNNKIIKGDWFGLDKLYDGFVSFDRKCYLCEL